MKRLALMIALVAGCSHKPCATTSECGNGEVCAAARCAALSCDQLWYAIDPATGVCTPLSGCVDPASVAHWQPCANPCAGDGENACLADSRCQATYSEADGTVAVPVRCAPGTSCGGTPAVGGSFRSCEPVAVQVDPCAPFDAARCVTDPRCELAPTGGGCFCESVDGGACDCPPSPTQTTCRQKACGELTSDSECKARPDCTTTPPVEFAQGGVGTTTPTPAPTPKSEPFSGCFSLSGCFGADENACRAQRGCGPVYAPNGSFATCAPQDFTRHCTNAADCNAGERCNSGGICVVQGCAGENEAECSLDPTCEPVYALQCSPYAASGGGGTCTGPLPVSRTGAASPNEAPAPVGGCQCEPSFAGCEPHGPGCDPGKSVLVRDPAILDDPFWAFSRVLAAVTGAGANDVADAWLPSLGVDATVGGKLAAGRPGASAFIAALPRTADGKLDASKIGFVPTSLSNRLDLADGASCGEARITYALSTGATDRRHRMTVIVELRQPYDGAGCRPTAQGWVALSSLDGAALESALQAIYTPLLTPANLKQIRTNEFLVGPQDPTQKPAAWELREFHLGSDARLHQSLLPLQIDPATATDSSFTTWVQANSDGLTKGTTTFPTQYQVPTATEDGSQLPTNPAVATLVNQSTCAGCHTTATNSAFAHVAERRDPAWRAEISQFLEGQLRIRAAHVLGVAYNRANVVLDVRPMH